MQRKKNRKKTSIDDIHTSECLTKNDLPAEVVEPEKKGFLESSGFSGVVPWLGGISKFEVLILFIVTELNYTWSIIWPPFVGEHPGSHFAHHQ